jgi:hypothetical protein
MKGPVSFSVISLNLLDRPLGEARVTKRRTKKEYTECMQEISKAFPQAKKIILVQDNLNTHSPSAFYQTIPPEEAFELK